MSVVRIKPTELRGIKYLKCQTNSFCQTETIGRHFLSKGIWTSQACLQIQPVDMASIRVYLKSFQLTHVVQM